MSSSPTKFNHPSRTAPVPPKKNQLDNVEKSSLKEESSTLTSSQPTSPPTENNHIENFPNDKQKSDSDESIERQEERDDPAKSEDEMREDKELILEDIREIQNTRKQSMNLICPKKSRDSEGFSENQSVQLNDKKITNDIFEHSQISIKKLAKSDTIPHSHIRRSRVHSSSSSSKWPNNRIFRNEINDSNLVSTNNKIQQNTIKCHPHDQELLKSSHMNIYDEFNTNRKTSETTAGLKIHILENNHEMKNSGLRKMNFAKSDPAFNHKILYENSSTISENVLNINQKNPGNQCESVSLSESIRSRELSESQSTNESNDSKPIRVDNVYSLLRSFSQTMSSALATKADSSASYNSNIPLIPFANQVSSVPRSTGHKKTSSVSSVNGTFSNLQSSSNISTSSIKVPAVELSRKTSVLSQQLQPNLPLTKSAAQEIHLAFSCNHRSLTNLPTIESSATITILILCHNLFTSIPVEICQLKNLKALSMSFNQIESILPQITDLINLQKLNLCENRINTAAVEAVSWGSFKSLQLLQLGYNRLDHFPKRLLGTEISLLSLSGNAISEIPKDISRMKKLQWLGLSQNKIDDYSPIFTIRSLLGVTLVGNPSKPSMAYLRQKAMRFTRAILIDEDISKVPNANILVKI